MTPATQAATRERGRSLSTLIEALHETERQIADLRADIPDAPTADKRRAVLVRRAKRQRRQSDIARQAAILNALPASVALLDAAGLIVAVNESWSRFGGVTTGYGPGHLMDTNYLDACAGARDSMIGRRVVGGIRAVMSGSQLGFSMEYACPSPTAERWMAMSVAPLGDGAPRGAVVMHVDVTEKHAAEENLRTSEDRFRQTQKMDAVGRLAAGITHDFNNQLSVIIAYAAFVHQDLGDGDPRRADIEEIQKAAMTAAALTRQLLVFSRQQVIAPRIIELGAIVDDAEKMLRRLIGEDIRLVTTHGGEPATAMIDQGHVEQIIMNLCINARDAMTRGGTLTIDTRVVDRDGRFAVLSVSDTGIGMSAGLRNKIFEPFFTTKGTGTGLGLATVQGIVTQCGGSIAVETEPGRGTRFTILLPFVSDGAASTDRAPAKHGVPNGTESILLAEDSAPVRAAIRHTLERFGYRVHEAATGALALELADGDETIDLLLTDVVMPEMGGRVLAEGVTMRRADVRVLYMSGYTDDAILRHGVSTSAVEYIEKPFTPDALVRKVRDVLDKRAR